MRNTKKFPPGVSLKKESPRVSVCDFVLCETNSDDDPVARTRQVPGRSLVEVTVTVVAVV